MTNQKKPLSLEEIKQMKKAQKQAPAGTYIEGIKLYTFEEVAQILGVSQRTAQTYYGDGKIKGRKLGKRVYILADSIAGFIRGDW